MRSRATQPRVTPLRFIRGGFFLWVVVPLALYGVYLAYGLPHAIWSYSWIDEGQGYDPHADRHYTRCTFIGPYGEFTIHPTNGQCPWVRFYKSDTRTS